MRLELTGVTVRYGAVVALDDVTMAFDQGQVTSVVGPNGAGKSTLLAVASGFAPTTSGRVQVDGREFRAVPHELASVGVRRTFQNPRVLLGASVLENALVGTHGNVRTSFVDDTVGTARRARREDDQRAAALGALGRVGLGALTDRPAGELAYGQVRLLEVARALGGNPRLLLLDEPAAGLNDDEASALGDVLGSLARDDGIGVVLVEHNLRLVGAVADVVVVLNFGRVLASGDPASVVRDPAVVEAYTGERV